MTERENEDAMKKTIVACVVGLAALMACTSESNRESVGCGDISGNYSVKVERVSGTCDPALDPATATIGMQRASDGSWLVILPGLEGGCPGVLDAATCKFTSACEFRDANGAVVGNTSISYTFSTSGYVGTTLTGVRPPAVATTCEVAYRETGTKL